jgi:hypothetical protein
MSILDNISAAPLLMYFSSSEHIHRGADLCSSLRPHCSQFGSFLIEDMNASSFVQNVMLRTWKTVSLVLDMYK